MLTDEIPKYLFLIFIDMTAGLNSHQMLLLPRQFCRGVKGVVPIVWCGVEVWKAGRVRNTSFETPRPDGIVDCQEAWFRSTLLQWLQVYPRRLRGGKDLEIVVAGRPSFGRKRIGELNRAKEHIKLIGPVYTDGELDEEPLRLGFIPF